ncbi:hypothetical protein GDO78_002176 [Eleutherodactylus coqui]|uniref:Uncharacterized protein n=1 Tax=Eleutherodactylus coqui TaxID=57060 RepID=A0A8J6KJN3_ELECQ|nr:hypothetical protein GDO78_002176 [Eleutherodactylus coqui]
MELISLLLSLVVILFLACVFRNQNNYKYSNFPPGPKALPLIGNLHMINIMNPQKSLMEMSKKYGSVFGLQFGMRKVVVLCGYDTVKDALINHAEEFAGRPVTALGNRTTEGHGIISANGENWKVMRRFTLSTLRDYGMGKKSIENKITEECECLIEKCKTYEGNSAHILYNSFPSVIGWLPGKHNKIFENYEEMQNFIRDTFTRKEKELDINNQRNLVDAFLATQREGKPESALYFHNKNLGVLVNDLFAAGMETTSTTLRWGLLLMMKYPEIQKKVQNEIENVIGSAQPRVEHRREMPYTDAVIHEIQRFGDIVPANLPHATTNNITFRGYVIPKGTIVFPLLHSALKDEAYFEKPEEFYPEHFLDSDGKFKKNEAFIPFSLGKRSCAGENLAKMELFLFFTSLLQNFIFQAPPGAELDLTPTIGITSAPLPHEICAIPRR